MYTESGEIVPFWKMIFIHRTFYVRFFKSLLYVPRMKNIYLQYQNIYFTYVRLYPLRSWNNRATELLTRLYMIGLFLRVIKDQNSLEYEIGLRQLSIKNEDSHSWFINIDKIFATSPWNYIATKKELEKNHRHEMEREMDKWSEVEFNQNSSWKNHSWIKLPFLSVIR